MEPSLTHEEFSKARNSKFKVELDENTHVDLELITVSDVKLYPQQEEFAVEFRGPLDKFLAQGPHNFSHEEMGQFELFIVPIKQDAEGFYYEAIFNRLRQQPAE